ncbi:MAG: hypothetical protein SGARI_003475, partial [Bacillariaceae sp.]
MRKFPTALLVVAIVLTTSTRAASSMLESDKDATDTEWGRATLPSQRKFDHDAATCGDTTTEIEEEPVEVAIIGGGLAGLAVAIGLMRTDIPCRIYERAPGLRSNSQGILAIQPNGMKALETIHPDLPDMIVEAGCERKQLVVTTIHVNGTIEENTRETGEEVLKKFGRLKVGLTWHKMQQLLASLLPSSEIVAPSRSLVSFEETEEDVILHFEDMSRQNLYRVRAKVVIACDGVFSVARQQVLANARDESGDAPIFFGQLNWATVIDTAKLPKAVHPPNAVHYFMHEGEPRWMSMINDGGSGQSFWQFRVADPDQALSLSCNNGR